MRTACKRQFKASKLVILKTREIGMFPLWGIRGFSCNSQCSFFFPVRSVRMTPWKEQQWNLKRKRTLLPAIHTHNLWNLWPEKTALKLPIPSLNWAWGSRAYVTTLCFLILKHRQSKTIDEDVTRAKVLRLFSSLIYKD